MKHNIPPTLPQEKIKNSGQNTSARAIILAWMNLWLCVFKCCLISVLYWKRLPNCAKVYLFPVVALCAYTKEYSQN